MSKIPSSKDLVNEALTKHPNLDINQLHAKVFELMVFYREKYYQSEVDSFFSRAELVNIPVEIKRKIKEVMLKPVKKGDTIYSNFMESASRPISQTFQVISGNVAELCVEKELIKNGLIKDIHFTRKKQRTDIIVYHPDIKSEKKRHRIEVKNVKMRERAARGLSFDGDSLIGFFNQPSEFTSGNIKIIDDICSKTGGYCYVPPSLLKQLSNAKRFRANTIFGKDMLIFVKTGKLP